MAVLVIARFGFHALFLPVFEGPDEPFHLGRILAFREASFPVAFRGAPLPPTVASSVAAHPCASDLHRAIGCPLFDGRGAAFNILGQTRSREIPFVVENYENQQPPLYYMLLGTAARLASGGSSRGARPVERDLLVLRLLSVALVVVAFGTLFRTSGNWSLELRLALLVGLLLPGSAESLARCSNDAALFLWSAAVVAALERAAPSRFLIPLIGIGPLVKLTALPVVVAAVVWLATRGRVRAAIAAGIASLLVVPFELLRGWSGSGAYDLSLLAFDPGGFWEMVRGLLRSIYTFGKTIFWVGGWSVFRAPRFLVIAWFALLAAVLISLRRRDDRHPVLPHVAGLLTAGAGLVIVAIGNRRVFGEWGGIGGWYFWTWIPWLAMAGFELFRVRRRVGTVLIGILTVFVLVANAVWIASALRVYG